MLASDSVRPSESLRAENVAELNVMAAKFRSNTEILRGLELLLKPTLGARVRHLRSETVIPPRADLQAYIHTGRTHTKHILQVMGDVKPEWAERITDGTISIFVKAGPKVPCSPLETVLNGANAEDFRPPHFFGYVEHGRLYVSVWEFIEGQRTPFEDLPIATLKRLVRAIACVNAIGAAPGVPRKTKWVSEPLDWYEKRFQRLAGGDQAKWQGALERLRRLLAQGDVVQNFIRGEGEQLLTHNDIHPNNVFTPAEGDIVIFDWEGATLSVPGADLRFLARMNDRDVLLETYIERMCELGYGLAAADVQRTFEIIESFRLIFKGWAKQKKLGAVLNALSMAERHISIPSQAPCSRAAAYPEHRSSFEAVNRNEEPMTPTGPLAPSAKLAQAQPKIAIFIPSFLRGKGGAEKVAAQVSNLIASNGGEPWVLCNARLGNTASYALADSVNLTPTELHLDDTPLISLASENFKLGIGFGMNGFYSRIVRVANLLNVPFIIQECTNPERMVRQLASSEAGNYRSALWLRQAVLAHVSAARFTVPSYARTVVDDVAPFTYGFYNSLPVAHSMEPPVVPNKKIIGVGMMKDENKNGMEAVRAFCEFSRTHPGWTLDLYGVNKFEDELEDIRRSHPYVLIVDHGMVSDPREMYADAHALVIPSFDEGLPNVVVEAFSNGVPCLGFADCPGVRDLIQHEYNGLLLERRDPESLSQSLRRLTDYALRSELGGNAKQFANEFLLFETWASNWLHMIENALHGRNSRGEEQTPAAMDASNPHARYWQALVRCHWDLRQAQSPRMVNFDTEEATA